MPQPETDAARRPLVAARTAALAVVAVALAGFAVLVAWVHDTREPKAIDTAVFDWLAHHVGTSLQKAMIELTNPVLTVGTCAVVAVVALLLRRWDVAALAVIGPLIGLGLEAYVLKPSIHRIYGTEIEKLSHGVFKAGLAFPSGHETGVTSVTVLLTLITLRGSWSRRVKAAVVTVMALWTAVAALALVVNLYHYFTDTVGGVLLGIAVMLTTAVVIDLVSARLSSPAGRGRTRTARAA